MSRASQLPPTTTSLYDAEARPYFLWWLDCTVGELRAHLQSPDRKTRAYFLGALLREANTRDVWLFTSPDRIREIWSDVVPHLGRARPMWTWLLGMHDSPWPPHSAREHA